MLLLCVCVDVRKRVSVNANICAFVQPTIMPEKEQGGARSHTRAPHNIKMCVFITPEWFFCVDMYIYVYRCIFVYRCI